MSLTEIITKLRVFYSKVIQRRIDSSIAKGEDAKDLIDMLYQVQTDDTILMEVVMNKIMTDALNSVTSASTSSTASADVTSINTSSTASTDVTSANISSTASADVTSTNTSSTTGLSTGSYASPISSADEMHESDDTHEIPNWREINKDHPYE